MRPANPGTTPTNVTGTVAVMVGQVIQYKEELRVFRKVENMELVLKSQLIDSLGETYFRGLRRRHTEYTTISYLRMSSNLCDTYGSIVDVDLIENKKGVDKPLDYAGVIEI